MFIACFFLSSLQRIGDYFQTYQCSSLSLLPQFDRQHNERSPHPICGVISPTLLCFSCWISGPWRLGKIYCSFRFLPRRDQLPLHSYLSQDRHIWLLLRPVDTECFPIECCLERFDFVNISGLPCLGFAYTMSTPPKGSSGSSPKYSCE